MSFPWLRMRIVVTFALPWLCLSWAAAQAQVLERLPALALRADDVTVSGLSSGGYMAGQFQVAYSRRLKGAAVIAGGPYGCSRGLVSTASLRCSCPAERSPGWNMQWMAWVPGLACEVLAPSVYEVVSDRATQGNLGAIDDPAHLRAHRVWLFSGGLDRVVVRPLVDALHAYYLRWGVPAAQIRHVDRADAAHGLPSLAATQPCGRTRTPFLIQCQFDAAGDLLQWLYPPGGGAPALQAQPVRTAGLKRFRQTRYTRGAAYTGLDSMGWVYVPAACEAAEARATCRLHVVFHGCEQSAGFVVEGTAFGLRFVREAGYNRWAEGSRIVVLYPQVQASTQGSLADPYRYNPKGCWDFWGYTERYAALQPESPNFAKASAPQMRAVMAMIEDLLRSP